MKEDIILFLGVTLLVYCGTGTEGSPRHALLDLEDEEDTLDRSARSYEVVPGARCGYFIRYSKMALYGYNTKTYADLTMEQCLEKCTDELDFHCRSVDYNPDSATSGDETSCFLSSENQHTIPYPDDFSPNLYTDHYERSCDEPEGDEGSAYDY